MDDPAATNEASSPLLDAATHCSLIYQFMSRFGRTTAPDGELSMNSFQFQKLVSSSRLRTVTRVDADLAFLRALPHQARGTARAVERARRLSYRQFIDALFELALIEFPHAESPAVALNELLVQHIFTSPAARGIEAAAAAGALTWDKRRVQALPLHPTQRPPPQAPLSPRAAKRNPTSTDSRRRAVSARDTDAPHVPIPASSKSASGGDFWSRVEAAAALTLSATNRTPRGDTAAATSEDFILHARSSESQDEHGGSSRSSIPSERDPPKFLLSRAAMVDRLASQPNDVFELVLRKAIAYEEPGNDHDSSSRVTRNGVVGAAFPAADLSLSARNDASVDGSYRSTNNTHDVARRPLPNTVPTQYQTRAEAAPVANTLDFSLNMSARLAQPMQQKSASSNAAPRRPPSPRGSASAVARSPSYGDRGWAPTIAGASNPPGSVLEWLSSPTSFTGVYRRAWEGDGYGRMGPFAETGVSAVPSRFVGNTNTRSDETIHDISVLMRPNLRVGRFFR